MHIRRLRDILSEDVNEFLNKLEIAISNIPNLDYIIILGDVLHNHETLHTESLNLAVLFFKCCKKYAKTFCLVGNHDYTNNSSFLKQNHWLNVACCSSVTACGYSRSCFCICCDPSHDGMMQCLQKSF